MKTNPNDPANPVHGGYLNDDPRNMILGGGLTKREHFAAMAMQGLIANGGLTGYHSVEDHGYGLRAVEIADDLIKALNKEEQ